jgi:hypothetical protein
LACVLVLAKATAKFPSACRHKDRIKFAGVFLTKLRETSAKSLEDEVPHLNPDIERQ